MGNTTGKKDKTHDEIEKKMQQAANDEANNQNLLLLGAGESGKSTLLRQMRHIWGKQFQANERANYTKIVVTNIVECMQTLCTQSIKLSQESKIKECEIDEKNMDALKSVIQLQRDSVSALSQELCAQITQLWSDTGIKATLLHRDKYYIMDCAQYFLDNLDAYAGTEYIPSFEDICHCRTRTLGMNHENFTFNGVLFTVYDLGGQRCARRKWLTVCDNVKAIIFLVSLAGYNQVIFEDNKTNRLIESWNVYDKYINHESFLKVNIILFLNKNDLFEELIKSVPFSVCPVEDYDGDVNSGDEVITYVIQEFQKRTVGFDHKKRTVFPHVTCATNTENVKAVFTAVRHIVLKNHLRDSAILH